jgi:DNA repair exonuclease SbcCD ATPase subunit
MQTRSQTIAELRQEIAEKDKKIWGFKLMVFGGPLEEGSIFESVGMIDQLEQKDAQIEEMQNELDDHRSRQDHQTVMFVNPATDKYINGLKEQIKELKNSYELLSAEKDEEIQTWKDTLDDHHVHYDNLKKKHDELEERYEVMEQTWISEEDADNIHDGYLHLIDELKMQLDDMTCMALNHWSGGQLTWDYDNRIPVIKKGKFLNIEKSAPDYWQELLDTLN